MGESDEKLKNELKPLTIVIEVTHSESRFEIIFLFSHRSSLLNIDLVLN